ncbi:hypothetical protein [Vibrio diazotrophicus]|uniref:hypothetical protein n=1 Tax=Vibrio diazotrophicus TaxID=685 RepID=UPI00142E33AF|nr:hypothetical protein [Vibrio diazotrophicus]NIY91108.1 hypothetical protein [Vibrio diazotrophicus]
MNPTLLALLQLLAGGQSQQQNPLLELLGGNQQPDLSQLLVSALSGATGQAQNSLSPQLLALLSGNQPQQSQQNGLNAQLLQLLTAGQAPKKEEFDSSKLMELLQKATGKTQEKTLEDQLAELLNGKKKEIDEDDILSRLQKRFEQNNQQVDSEADLTEAIEFGLTFDKFVQANDDMFPSWFNVSEIKEDVDKWAKTPSERSQGLAAATVRAFFKNSEMLDLLEERDRNTVKEKIIKEGVKSHEIDRKQAWPLIERAIFNKNKLSEMGSPAPTGKEEKAIEEYGSIFEIGQQANNVEPA